MPIFQRSLSAKLPTVFFDCFRFHLAKRLAALLLAIQMLFLPASVSAAALGDAIRESRMATAGMWTSVLNWLTPA